MTHSNIGASYRTLADMLSADEADRNDASRRDGERRAEEAFQHEDAFGVMAKSPVPEIGGDRFRFIEPLVKREIVLRRAALFLGRRQRVMIAMSHRGLPQKMC